MVKFGANNAIEPGAVWRHKKRGTSYVEVARGELQAEPSADLCEGDEMIAYRGDDGRVWFRRVEEFEDGRFERLATTPAQSTAARDPKLAALRPDLTAAEQVTAEPVALTPDLMSSTSVSCTGLDITIACDDHDTKDAIMNVLTDTAFAAPADQAVKALENIANLQFHNDYRTEFDPLLDTAIIIASRALLTIRSGQ